MTTLGDAEPATVRERALAYLSDLVVVGGCAVAVARGSGRSPRDRPLLTAGFALALANLYHVVLEGTLGRTVGKAVVGIRVATGDGRRPSVRAAAIRTALRAVDWLPAGYLVGLVSVAVTERRQRVGDLAAGTVVVRSGGRDD